MPRAVSCWERPSPPNSPTGIAGKTRNPHNPEHTPGGSSSGSAAAVADFHVPLAIGTQTGGSVIRPSSYCGVYGYKPSFQFFGNAGVRTNTEQFDTVGIMARSVAISRCSRRCWARCLTVRRVPMRFRRPRIGFCRTPQWDHALPETRSALDETRKALEKAGAEVFDFDLPDFFDGVYNAHRVVCGFESTETIRTNCAAGPTSSAMISGASGCRWEKPRRSRISATR